EKIISPGLQRRHQPGELRGIDDDRALETSGDLIREIDVEPFVAARHARKCMRRERAVDRGAQRRKLLRRARRRDEQHDGAYERECTAYHQFPLGNPATRVISAQYSNLANLRVYPDVGE